MTTFIKVVSLKNEDGLVNIDKIVSIGRRIDGLCMLNLGTVVLSVKHKFTDLEEIIKKNKDIKIMDTPVTEPEVKKIIEIK